MKTLQKHGSGWFEKTVFIFSVILNVGSFDLLNERSKIRFQAHPINLDQFLGMSSSTAARSTHELRKLKALTQTNKETLPKVLFLINICLHLEHSFGNPVLFLKRTCQFLHDF